MRRSAVPATRTDINNNTVLARARIDLARGRELLLLQVHVLLGASTCYNCYELEPEARQSKAYTLLHVMYVLALHAQDNGCGNAAVFWSLSTLFCFPFVNHTGLPPSRAKDEVGSSHGNKM